MVPLPIDGDRNTFVSCCGRVICVACIVEQLRANRILNRRKEDKELENFVPLKVKCAFCRTECTESNEREIERLKDLVCKGGVNAMFELACGYMEGEHGLPKDDGKALELLGRAANLDYAEAYGTLGRMYTRLEDGDWPVPYDAIKEKEYLELGAKKGSVGAKTNLGVLAATTGNYTDAIQHWRLSAGAGSKEAMKNLWKCFFKGLLCKAELEDILRDHQTGLDGMKTEERERSDANRKAQDDGDVDLINLYRLYYDGFLSAKELNAALEEYNKSKT